jgi:hypothetical protein
MALLLDIFNLLSVLLQQEVSWAPAGAPTELDRPGVDV